MGFTYVYPYLGQKINITMKSVRNPSPPATNRNQAIQNLSGACLTPTGVVRESRNERRLQ